MQEKLFLYESTKGKKMEVVCSLYQFYMNNALYFESKNNY